MIRSMFSGVTGLRSHQTMMDVVGNNIANVNTASFKASRVVFTDVYYQTLSAGSLSGEDEGEAGGTNPSQIGYGTQVASIDILNTRGGYMQTDKETDLYIAGEGYFVVGNTETDVAYTRVGNFTFDPQGYLVDAQGNHVRGLNDDGGIDPEDMELDDLEAIQVDKEDYTSIAIGQNGIITGVDKETGEVVALAQIALAIFPNPDGLIQSGNMYYSAGINAGEPTFNEPNTTVSGALIANGLEMSNVDLSKQFTDMIIAQRGFQANSRVITTSDEILQELVNLKR
jgi:flagellar hook protein FlgE